MNLVTCAVCGKQFFALDGIAGVEHPRPGDEGRHSWVWPTTRESERLAREIELERLSKLPRVEH